ncbi:hypothetical protein P8A19_10295 [Streptomyces poriferorum]|uniref:Uncharacterized protein n=2 Tax=Streptomyces poriferorum TaxID=2798799 RepID=A0ABY9IL32_9ACTN|nr:MULTISPECIES: hypothetical protein [unclassified Streptomyces]MDP5315331.1 hypothetical protein [Streptomyces sp. Alt4]WLQ55810.1 hypothetical protein P8A19_10295 [Streptomyces sp. Alt2]
MYEMRTLCTGAERDEAAALVQDRQRWLTMRGLPVPARADIPALFRNPQAKPAGLFEDGLLLACMIPQHVSGLSWGQGSCLFLSCIHTLPNRSDDTLQLITLWASDFAARCELPFVRAEALARQPLDVDPIAPFLRRLTDMGWAIRGSGTGLQEERVARLELIAKRRSGLSALIACRVHEPQSSTDSRSIR